MKQPKTEPITGEITNIEKREGKKNAFYLVDILASIDGYDGKADEVVYQFKAFGKMADKIVERAVGDYVTVVCYVQANEWQGKHYVGLSLASIEAHSNAVPVEQVQESTQEQSDGQDTTLPF